MTAAVSGPSTTTQHALDALRLQYREYAEALEQRFLRQSGFRLATTMRTPPARDVEAAAPHYGQK